MLRPIIEGGRFLPSLIRKNCLLLGTNAARASFAWRSGVGGKIMQTRLKTALAAAGFALAMIPAFAVEMPTEGSKNFSTPSDAPSYFSNESARVDRAVTFDEEDARIGSTTPHVRPAVSTGMGTGRHDHAAAHKSTRHSQGKSRAHWHFDWCGDWLRGISQGWVSPSSLRLSPACLGDGLPYPAEAVDRTARRSLQRQTANIIGPDKGGFHNG